MVIDTKKNKLNLKRIAIAKINLLIYTYMNQFDVESIHLQYFINETQYTQTLYYGSNKTNIDWYTTNGSILLQILECLKNKDFYGMCRLQNGQLVKITPKKNKNV